MAASSTTRATPGHSEVAARFVVRAAVAAPSVHNTQPWYFVSHQNVLKLYADPRRRLASADPTGREMILSCGAALFNLRLAMRHLGFAIDVQLTPELSKPHLLAEITWGRHTAPTPYEELLYFAIGRRHSHRGPFSSWVPKSLISELARIARQEYADLHIIEDAGKRRLLSELTLAAELTQRSSAHYTGELARWTPPPGEARHDGVPADAYPVEPDGLELATRDFAHGTGWGFPLRPRTDATASLGVVVLLTTREDRRLNWLLAGQALQRLLLQASVNKISAAFHTQALELPGPRDQIRSEITGGAYPQMLMRFGGVSRSIVTPRRPVTETLIEQN